MTPTTLEGILEKRDELIATCDEFRIYLPSDNIEVDEIRELGKIVLETANEETVFFWTT